MATFKPSNSISGISGKIGGTSFSKQSQYNTIRNSPNGNKTPDILQSKRRFLNGSISQQWRELSPAQRTSYETEAPFYKYKNSFGQDIPRTGYGLFLYLAQNLINFDIKAPGTAPAFAAVTAPIISIDSATPSELIISGTDINSDYGYNIWAKPNNRPGQNPSKKYIELCGSVTPGQLTAGVDVWPLIKNRFKFEFQNTFVFLAVEAVNLVTGNKVSDFELMLIDTKEVIPTIIKSSTFNPSNVVIGAGLIQPDGMAIYQSFHTGARNIRQFNLSTSFDLSTASSGPVYPPGSANPRNLSIDPSGQHLYECYNAYNFLNQRYLSTPWDFSTVVNIRTFTMATNMVNFSNDGLKMFNFRSNRTEVWDLSTPFDISTLTLNHFRVHGFTTIRFFGKSDGTKIYVYRNDSRLYTYDLSTPWDLTSWSINGSPLNFTGQISGNSFPGMVFDNSGKYLLMSNHITNPQLQMFTLSVPWKLPDSF